jgi:hypothetical protein
MFGGVPAEGRNAIAGPDSEAPKGSSETGYPAGAALEGRPQNLLSVKGGHLAVPKNGRAVVKNRLDRQLTVLHGA